MTPELRRRAEIARDEFLNLTPEAADLYFRDLHDSDPDLAAELAGLLAAIGWWGGSNAPTATHELKKALTHQHSANGSRSTPSPHRTVGRFQLVRVVGRGGFGEVWEAYDPILQKPVAIKVPLPSRPDTSAAFLREARKAAALRHPSIVQVYDVGEVPGGWYIVSEFIAGQSLHRRIEAGPVPIDVSVRIVAAVAGALHAAHLAGLVHRDVKPGNILLDQAGHAYLSDFGLAVDEGELLADRARVSGTFAYMPPEQIRGDTHLMDGRADIYSLGAVLYELLTGRRMFRGKDFHEYQELILDREPRPPRAINDQIPVELERICLRCVSKEVRDRYTTAKDLADELNAWLTRLNPTALPPVSTTRSLTWIGGLVSGLSLVVLFAVLGRWFMNTALPVSTPTKPSEGSNPTSVMPRKDSTVKPLLWPWGCEVCKWEVLPETNQLKIYADATTLLQLGETDADSWEFSASVKQLNPVGRVGLFLGYRRDPTTTNASYELVHLEVDSTRPYMKRTIKKYRYDIPFINADSHICESVPIGTLAPENLIRLVVRNGLLREISLNGKVDPGMMIGTLHPISAGGFGVYARNCDAVFSRILMNNTPLPLLADLSRTIPENP